MMKISSLANSLPHRPVEISISSIQLPESHYLANPMMPSRDSPGKYFIGIPR
jgi:hypothetical protein